MKWAACLNFRFLLLKLQSLHLPGAGSEAKSRPVGPASAGGSRPWPCRAKRGPIGVCVLQAGLPGFYDPCVGEEKNLKVLYQFRGVLHQVMALDSEALRIPKQCE